MAVSQSFEECRQVGRLLSGKARQCVPPQVTWVLPGTAANKIAVVVRWRFFVMACTEDWILPCAIQSSVSQAAVSHLSPRSGNTCKELSKWKTENYKKTPVTGSKKAVCLWSLLNISDRSAL